MSSWFDCNMHSIIYRQKNLWNKASCPWPWTHAYFTNNTTSALCIAFTCYTAKMHASYVWVSYNSHLQNPFNKLHSMKEQTDPHSAMSPPSSDRFTTIYRIFCTVRLNVAAMSFLFNTDARNTTHQQLQDTNVHWSLNSTLVRGSFHK